MYRRLSVVQTRVLGRWGMVIPQKFRLRMILQGFTVPAGLVVASMVTIRFSLWNLVATRTMKLHTTSQSQYELEFRLPWLARLVAWASLVMGDPLEVRIIKDPDLARLGAPGDLTLRLWGGRPAEFSSPEPTTDPPLALVEEVEGAEQVEVVPRRVLEFSLPPPREERRKPPDRKPLPARPAPDLRLVVDNTWDLPEEDEDGDWNPPTLPMFDPPVGRRPAG